MGWYRKHFKLSESDKGKVIYIDFDGVYRNSRVWLNGHLLGFRPNGYVSFRYDLNTVSELWKGWRMFWIVQADNSDQPNSRWYSVRHLPECMVGENRTSPCGQLGDKHHYSGHECGQEYGRD